MTEPHIAYSYTGYTIIYWLHIKGIIDVAQKLQKLVY
jgi:hypothetical protein